MDAARRYAEATLEIVEQLKTDAGLKKQVVEEIKSYARKQYPEPAESEGPRGLSKTQTDDYVYTVQLIELLARASLEDFLAVAADVLAAPEASNAYKKTFLDKVLGQRIRLRIVDPERLQVYDRQVLALGMRFVDEADGARFTFGDRGDFQSFVHNLIGYEVSGVSLPPIDREKGLQFARNHVADKNLFVEKEWYMGQIARFDPAVRAEYVQGLKEHVHKTDTPDWLRPKYAKKLVALGEMSEEQWKEMEKSRGQSSGSQY